MIESAKRGLGCGLIAPLALGLLASFAGAQEREDPAQDVWNVQFVFQLVQADGFTDEDPEISDVVKELRMAFNFRGYRLLSTSVLNVGLVLPYRGSPTVDRQRVPENLPGQLRQAFDDPCRCERAPFYGDDPRSGDPHRPDRVGDDRQSDITAASRSLGHDA